MSNVCFWNSWPLKEQIKKQWMRTFVAQSYLAFLYFKLEQLAVFYIVKKKSLFYFIFPN